jgi:hypothetical protein
MLYEWQALKQISAFFFFQIPIPSSNYLVSPGKKSEGVHLAISPSISLAI